MAQIVHARGPRVIGIDQVRPNAQTPAASIIENFIPSDSSPQDIGAEVKRLTRGRDAEVVYDAVGGVTTPAALRVLPQRNETTWGG